MLKLWISPARVSGDAAVGRLNVYFDDPPTFSRQTWSRLYCQCISFADKGLLPTTSLSPDHMPFKKNSTFYE